MKKIVLLSDSHNSIDKRFIPYLKQADEIWHAGDIGNIKITDQLKEYAHIKAVWGNIDDQILRKEFSETLFFKTEKVKVMMTHIGMHYKTYTKKILPLINNSQPNLFIYGHSHILKIQFDKQYNMLCINPGACGNTGIHKVKTIVQFNINKEKIKDLNIIEIPRKY
tara:strand:- start:3692 stop:4189 length:498 start_codon:yes stop_codon:yes gene_type:complete